MRLAFFSPLRPTLFQHQRSLLPVKTPRTSSSSSTIGERLRDWRALSERAMPTSSERLLRHDNSRAQNSSLCDRPRPSPLLLVPQSYSSSSSLSFPHCGPTLFQRQRSLLPVKKHRGRGRLGNDCEIGAPSLGRAMPTSSERLLRHDNSRAQNSPLCDRPRPSPLLLVPQSYSSSSSLSFPHCGPTTTTFLNTMF
jgi:hypothetical protein